MTTDPAPNPVSNPQLRGTRPRAHTRARYRATGFDRANVPDDERARLAVGVGALLRARRRAVGRTWKWPGVWVPGLSLRVVAAEAGCSSSTLSSLERGLQRPRRSMLRSLAEVLAPDDPGGFTAELVAAAGPSLRPDTVASLRRRRRRTRRVAMTRYRWAQWAEALENESVFGLTRALTTLDLRPINLGCRPDATAEQLDRAAAALSQLDVLKDIAEHQRAEARRLWRLVHRHPAHPAPEWRSES